MEYDFPYPLGIQSFPELRRRNCIYVDKTADVNRLITSSKYYFLSRPRRFGKSLLVSTIEEYFLGHREWFGGLAIDVLQPQEWPEHAVLHFDFSKSNYTKPEDVEIILDIMLSGYEKRYGIEKRTIGAAPRFNNLIDRAYEATGRQVVVLIDEYDLPIINSIGNPELEEYNRAVLKGFYGVMKSQDAHLRFVLLTGVGKLGHLSVFSGLNNINDISLDAEYSTICGISEEELHKYFDRGVTELAESYEVTKDEAYAMLKRHYDGYHFSSNLKDVYNPYSLINCLSKREISDYWFGTGTPTHLLKVLKMSDGLRIGDFDDVIIHRSNLEGADVVQYHPVPFMFYTGYLTIRKYDRMKRLYTLGYPNGEVKEGFVRSLFPMVSNQDSTFASNFIFRSIEMIENGRIDDFLVGMKSFFSGIPYELSVRNEYFYQNVMYCIATLMGFYVQAEYRTSQGRIDMLLANSTTVYVMEFKLDGTAEQALAQINERNYALPFAQDGRRIVKIGVNFSSATRTLDKWIIENQ